MWTPADRVDRASSVRYHAGCAANERTGRVADGAGVAIVGGG